MAGLTTQDVAAKARQRFAQLTQRGGARDEGRESTDGKESAIVEALDSLGSGWERIDDIKWPGYEFANIDHVLVGPAGVFVIDMQPGKGIFDLDHATAMRRDSRSPKPAVEDVVSAAHAVGSLLGMVHRRPMAVLCLVDETNIETTVGDALICSLDKMPSRLKAMAPILDEKQVSDMTEKLRKDLVLVTGRLASVPSQRIWTPDPGSAFDIDSLGKPEEEKSWARRFVPLGVAAAAAAGIFTYAAFHIDEAFDGKTTSNHQTPSQHGKADKGSGQ
ncbi:MAG TPA: nuclease-related domain-containing protein [Nocardioidaceae bacterium]|nr:nuclease-related domain-containing protein [Nocardioidaceae bacterium]